MSNRGPKFRLCIFAVPVCLFFAACSSSYEKKPEGPVNRAAKGVVSGAKAVGTGAIDVTGYVVGGVAEGTERAVSGSPGAVSKGINRTFDTTSDVVGGTLDSTTQSPISDKARAQMSGKVNCQTARQDVSVLERERASTLKQISSGVGSVVPISAAVRVLSGNYRDGVTVASGQYNKDLEARIALIKRTCGLR